MPLLSKSAPRLLRRVNGQTHARAQDHNETADLELATQTPMPPSRTFSRAPQSVTDSITIEEEQEDEADILADPISSDDEDDSSAPVAVPTPRSRPAASKPARATAKKRNASIGVSQGIYERLKGHDSTVGDDSGSEGKRKRGGIDNGHDMDSFSMELDSKKKKKGFGKSYCGASSAVWASGTSRGNRPEFKVPKSAPMLQSVGDIPRSGFKAISKEEPAVTSKLRGPGFRAIPRLDSPPGFRSDESDNGSSETNPTMSKSRTPINIHAPQPGKGKPKTKVKEGTKTSAFRAPPAMPSQLIKSGTEAASFRRIPHLQGSDAASSDLSSPPSSPMNPESQLSMRVSLSPERSGAVCPMCGAVVDADFLHSFKESRVRMDWRAKEQFCKEHQHREAHEEYRRRGYPEIDWDGLLGRLQGHNRRLQAVMEEQRPSHFRGLLAQKIASGRHRTLKQAMGSDDFKQLTPGYYGSKGGQMMMNHINQHFSRKLHQIAPSDKLIAAKGIPNFIQAVLVPELATALVIEDMDVDEERAIEILSESRQIGDTLHEAEDDVVKLQESQMGGESEVVWDMWSTMDNNNNNNNNSHHGYGDDMDVQMSQANELMKR